MKKNEIHSDMTQYVTVVIGGQLFGIPINKVHDVFMPESITRVPLSEKEIQGVLNLRGRIVTAIGMRQLLGLERPTATKPKWPLVLNIKANLTVLSSITSVRF